VHREAADSKEEVMRLKYLIAVPAIFLAAACKDKDTKVDDALNNDLSLAAQSQAAPLDSISGVERGYTTGTNAPAPVARTSTRRTTSAPVRRTSSTRRSSSSGSSGTYYPAPAPAPTVVKHTKRDAAIGAAAGAVIGAATSRNKVKGAVIGGATGAILGAVIGNNVDKTKR
jgi:hypothetical protein